MGKKSAENLLARIEGSKSRRSGPAADALSIRHVGTRVAEVLAERFGSMDELIEGSVGRGVKSRRWRSGR